MSGILAAALGSAAGAVTFLVVIFVICYCLFHKRRLARTSETDSSDPSIEAGNIEFSLGGAPYTPESQGGRRFTLEELNTATNNFSNVNLIGYGTFGEVSKGLLQNGMIVALKCRTSTPSQQFVEEVGYLSSIRHRNLVTLLGYCQENDLQILVYEYVANGSISAHLYGASHASSRKLEFKHRLSIAHGAAKGISYLHSLNPPLLHMKFKTQDVLVDEDFIPKVADAGVHGLIDRIDGAAPSLRLIADDPFPDPEVKESGRFTEKSDVYSFGVFLLELVSGCETRSDQSIITWVQSYQESSNISDIIDKRMGTTYTSQGMRDFLRLISWCLNPSRESRPLMNYVELEIQRIREKEITLTTIMGEGTTTVTLGSQLFTK